MKASVVTPMMHTGLLVTVTEVEAGVKVGLNEVMLTVTGPWEGPKP